MNEKNLYSYQKSMVEHITNNLATGVFLDCGLGKTICTLTAIDRLMFEDLDITKVLVIAPKKVAEHTWSSETELWDHIRHLKLSLVLGTERQRKEALQTKADIFVINRENVAWLVSYYQSAWPFDCVVIDELSSFKNAQSVRFKALRMIRPKVRRVIGLTGTPAPNNLLDLWAQLYLLDMGERLGKTVTSYREKYFNPGKRNGQIVYEYKLKTESEQAIYDKIGDICISMKAKDYLDLPERINRTVAIRLPQNIKQKYDEFERDQILAMDDLDEISAVNAAALTNKLLQFANGAVYDSAKNWYEVHREKLEALEEIVESANGQPVLVFYSYKHDFERICKYLKKHHPAELKTPANIKTWNERKIPLLLAHPASAGHGLNLQAGGNIIVWFGLSWSLELYQQANARLDRQGQTKSVIVHHLVATGTMDEDVVKSLEGKAKGQDALMEAVKARVAKVKRKLVA